MKTSDTKRAAYALVSRLIAKHLEQHPPITDVLQELKGIETAMTSAAGTAGFMILDHGPAEP